MHAVHFAVLHPMTHAAQDSLMLLNFFANYPTLNAGVFLVLADSVGVHQCYLCGCGNHVLQHYVGGKYFFMQLFMTAAEIYDAWYVCALLLGSLNLSLPNKSSVNQKRPIITSFICVVYAVPGTRAPLFNHQGWHPEQLRDAHADMCSDRDAAGCQCHSVPGV